MTSTDKFLILLACLLAHRTTSNRIWPPNFKMTSWREEKSYFRSWHQYANLKHPVRVPFLLFHTHSQRGYFLGVFDCCRPFLVECFMTLEPLFKGHIPMSISHSFAKAQLKNCGHHAFRQIWQGMVTAVFTVTSMNVNMS